jgi:phosphopantetheine adenylyltransferase
MDPKLTELHALQTRQLASQACKRLLEIRRSVTLLDDSKVEDMPKWKRDTLSRAEQHLVNCVKSYRAAFLVKNIGALKDLQKEHAKNLAEQRIPPFKSRLQLKTHDQDIAKLLKEFASLKKKASVFF